MRGQSALEHGADVRKVLATPEKLAVDDKARHPEDALFLGGTADCFDLAQAFVGSISRKASRFGAGLGQYRADDFGVLDVELALPEPLENDVVIAAEDQVALLLRPQHAAGGEGRIPDLLRAADDEAALVGLATAIHVAVVHTPPLMGITRLFDDPSLAVDPGGAEKARYVEDIGQPVEAEWEVALELV